MLLSGDLEEPYKFRDGYHGTDFRAAENIVKVGFRPYSNESTDDPFLGPGVYFYEDSELQAQQWARIHLKKKPHLGKRIGVIRSLIYLGECFFVDHPEYSKVIAEIEADLAETGDYVDRLRTIEIIVERLRIDTV